MCVDVFSLPWYSSPDGWAIWGVVMSTRCWLLVDHCVLRNWDRILVRAVKGLISRAGMVSICPLLWQRDVKLKQTNCHDIMLYLLTLPNGFLHSCVNYIALRKVVGIWMTHILIYCIPRTKYVRGILWFSRRYASASASAYHRLRDNLKNPYRIASIFYM